MCNEYLIEIEKERRAMQDGFEPFEPRKEKGCAMFAIPVYVAIIFVAAFLLGYYFDYLSRLIWG